MYVATSRKTLLQDIMECDVFLKTLQWLQRKFLQLDVDFLSPDTTINQTVVRTGRCGRANPHRFLRISVLHNTRILLQKLSPWGRYCM